jgi:hypothetical protein
MAHSSSDAAPEKDGWVWDPAYLDCLRELWVIVAVFVMLLAWTIGLSYFIGYGEAAGKPVALIAGIPRWFVWGVAAPWVVGTVVSIYFALVYMTDHEPPEAKGDAKEHAEGGA